ncbi:MAG: hypothetical protein JXB85_05465 [Anaerolineales bacterium]|nr:hypothetical protein [Anaerolineales bacterium]
MKMHLFLCACLILCGAGGLTGCEGTDDITSEPTPRPTSRPTRTPTPQPNATPDLTPPAVFSEEFETDLAHWSPVLRDQSNETFFFENVDESLFSLIATDGELVFDLQGPNLELYLVYDRLYYDMRLSVVAANRGVNSNGIVLVCGMNDYDDGWFEFVVSNSGEYEVRAFDRFGDGFRTIHSGASTAIRSGEATNEYTATCTHQALALAINGQEALDMPIPAEYETFYKGSPAIAIASYDLLPVTAAFQRLTITWP